ncbi:MAG: CHAT domain-containing protein [Dokdonella sp.]
MSARFHHWRVALPLLLLAVRVAPAGTLPSGHVRIDCATSSRVRVAIPQSADLVLDVQGDGSGWIAVEERGADIALSGAEATAEISVPPRYGRFLVAINAARLLHVRRIRPSNSYAEVVVEQYCDPLAGERAYAGWYSRAAALSMRLGVQSHSASIDELIADAARLRDDAPDMATHALALHMRAQALYRAGRTSESTQAFAVAELAWRAARDAGRALTARVGRVEDLIREGKYREAVALTVPAFVTDATDTYFSNRLKASRCFALGYLGELEHAVSCYERSIEKLKIDGERAERASMLLDLADVLRSQGRRHAAERDILLARALAIGPDAPVLRGRADMLFANLRLDRGDISDALSRLEAASMQFESVNSPRWQANAMLRAASVYAQIGALEESRALIDASRRQLSKKDAPARVAEALLLSAKIDLRAGRVENALHTAREVETIYADLAMPGELDMCRSFIASLLLNLGQLDAADAMIGRTERQPDHAMSWALLEARLAILRSRLGLARSILEKVHQHQLPLTQQIELTELECRWLLRMGEQTRAGALLRSTAENVAASARSVGNPLVADLLLHQVMPLRALAVEQMLRHAPASTTEPPADDPAAANDAWYWLQLTNHSQPRMDRAGLPAEDAEAFDAAVARELLTDSRERDGRFARPTSARALFSILSHKPDNTNRVREQGAPGSLLDLQRSLAEGVVFVAYLDGETIGALLWVTRDHASLVAAPAGHVLREQTRRLTDLISKPSSPVASIHALARELSMQLLHSAPGQAPPSNLLVDASADLGTIPWGVMYWRGAQDELVERTAVTFANVQAGCCDRSKNQPALVHVLVAGQSESPETQVRALPMAGEEPHLIVAALGARHLPLSVEPLRNRDGLFEALSRNGDWVHVVAHGRTLANRIGYSGIWLDSSSAGIQPKFVSALDVLGEHVRSNLVVLDACQLSERSNDGMRPALSFADAVARAGARDVVAALWPISDSAAAIWVPSFYSTVRARGTTDVAQALHHAQLSLRETREFRHPFYWASLVHEETVQLAHATGAIVSTHTALSAEVR